MDHAGHHQAGPGSFLGVDPFLVALATFMAGALVVLVVVQGRGRLRWPVPALLALALGFHSHLDHALGVDHSPPPLCCLLVVATLTTPSHPEVSQALWGAVTAQAATHPAQGSFDRASPIRSPPARDA